MLVKQEYNYKQHEKLHGMVRYGRIRIRDSICPAFQHMEPIFHKAVYGALISSSPPRTGRVYELSVNGTKRQHTASRFGEVPAPLTGQLADSVAIVYDATNLQIVELAPHAKLLEGRKASMLREKRFRPHLAKLCNPKNVYLRNILQTKMDKAIKQK
jgi:hypothetical protein